MPPEFTRSVDISIQQLHTFRKVMECGGYAAAAKVSHLSTPAVWQHIQALENAYGVQLFERVGRQVKPTAAATRLHESMTRFLCVWNPLSMSFRNPIRRKRFGLSPESA